jgi:flagellar biosynthesis regulator FlbT
MNLQATIPPPDSDLSRLSAACKERDRYYRAIKNIRALIPAEILRPKNEHLHTAVLQRIHNELTKLIK